MCLFICEFSIRGQKLLDVSTANNEAYLYLKKRNFGRGQKYLTTPDLDGLLSYG
jgi:hypothetical protein